MMEHENIDKLAKSLLMDFEADVPSHIWPAVEEQLKEKKRRRVVVWWTSIAAGLLVLLSFSSGFWLSSRLGRTEHADVSIKRHQATQLLTSHPLLGAALGNSSGAAGALGKCFVPRIQSRSIQLKGAYPLNAIDTIARASDKIEKGRLLASVSENQEGFSGSGDEELKYLESRSAMLTGEKIGLAYEYKKMPIFMAEEPVHQLKIRIGAQFSPFVASSSSESSSGSADLSYANQPSAGLSYLGSNKASASTALSTTRTVDTRAYSCGIPCEIEIGKRLGLQTGLFLSLNQQLTNNSSSSYISDNQEYLDLQSSSSVQMLTTSSMTRLEANNLSFDRGVDVANTKLTQDFYYLEVPILLKYRLVERRFGVFVQTGLVTGVLAKNAAKLENQYGRVWSGKTDEMNAFVFQSNVSLGLQFALSPKISIVAIPSFRYCLNGYSSNKNVYNFPISFGVYTGVNIKI